MKNREIGGYFSLEGKYDGIEFHKGISLNSGRNCLQLLIREYCIKKIYLPYYLCLVIKDTCLDEKVKIIYYHIDSNFLPNISTLELDDSSYVYIVNYFGFLNLNKIQKLKRMYKNIIIDNTHAFFDKVCKNIPTIYNCRKYFGVPDGAYLYANINNVNIYPKAKSYSRIKHLIGRIEEGAPAYYSDFLIADKTFDHKNIELMSNFTHFLLSGIDYKTVKKVRRNNFLILNNYLSKINSISISKTLDFMYPLLIEKGRELRNYLISNKIYIPKLWPNLDKFPLNDFEHSLFDNLVCIPIDQRYTSEEMQYILTLIGRFLGDNL